MPICSGSRSIWTSCSGTGMRRQSVRTSVNRQPTASMASAWGRAALARAERRMAQRPGLALVDQPLGVEGGDDRACSRSASRLTSSAAPAQSAPPPARMIGRWARPGVAAAARSLLRSTRGSSGGAKASIVRGYDRSAAASGPGARRAPRVGDGRRSSPGTPGPPWPGSARLAGRCRTTWSTGRKIASRSISW